VPFARPVGNRCVLALDGRRYALDPATPELLAALATGSLSAIFPGFLARPARTAVYLRLLDPADPLDTHHVEQIVDAYLREVTGWGSGAACRLAAALERSWQVLDGQAAAEGVDLLALPAGRTLNWIYARAAEGAEYDEHDHPGARARLDRDLAAPLEADAPSLLDWSPIEGWAARGAAAAYERTRPLPHERVPGEPEGFSSREQADSFRSAVALLGSTT
jgi:hypothetical protein